MSSPTEASVVHPTTKEQVKALILTWSSGFNPHPSWVNDLVSFWNMCVRLYRSNKKQALNSKECWEIEKCVRDFDANVIDLRDIDDVEGSWQGKLLNRTQDKVSDAYQTYKSCEDMRTMCWYVLTQRRRKAYKAYEEHRECLTEFINSSQDCFNTEEWNTYSKKLMNESNNNKKFLMNLDRMNYWDWRTSKNEKVWEGMNRLR